MRATFKKHSIVGENNPYWALAEPILFRIWADGILNSTYFGLQFANLASLMIYILFFVIGTVMRIVVVASVLLAAFLIFPETLSICFNLLFSDWKPNYVIRHTEGQWLYLLLAYAILIRSATFVLGSNFSDLACDTLFQVSLMLTKMIPLKLIARGLQKEN